MWVRCLVLTDVLLLISLFVGCGRDGPIQPVIQAAPTAGSGSTLPAPSGTSAIAVSESQIDVTWQSNSTNETGFEVYRSTDGATGTFTLRASTGRSVTSFSDATLTPSTAYCYKVRAVRVTARKTSFSAFSATACATTLDPPPPLAVFGVDARPANSTTVSVTWIDNATYEDGFRIERSTDEGASWTTAGTVGSNSQSFFDGGQASEQPVCYRVVAFNAAGESPPSGADCTTPPAAPTDLTLTLVDPLTYEFELTWSDNSAVEDAYEVWTCWNVGYWACGFFDRLPANATSYQVWWDDPWFFVMATKDGGYSDESNHVIYPEP